MIMRIPSNLVSLTTKALAESMDAEVMAHLAKELVYDYDLHKRTGIHESMSIPQRDAALQIITDMINLGLFYYFICILIRIQANGFKGRMYRITYMNEIIKRINECGYIYDNENKIFVENPAMRRTKNWGALIEGKEYHFAFLRIDIAENSKLVRKYPEKLINEAYSDVREIVETSIDKRNGRIWNWEGDGGLVAFYFSNKDLQAALSGIEIINKLFIYNLSHCRLDEPLKVRIAVHSGLCRYTEDLEAQMKDDVIKLTVQIESQLTKPNSMTISNTVRSKLYSSLLSGLETTQVDDLVNYANYSIVLEQ
jgi:class 3 adenylate cyclase